MVGEQVLGRFTIEHRIGSGGFGTVYRAWDDRLARAVAVKVIERGGGARVMREAQAAARLAHPGIVTVYELAQDNRNAYLVTELIDGGTLRDLHYDGRLDDHSLALIGVEAADALAHAHAAGVVHRDVKPHNILIDDESGETKLVDFGIARLLDEPGLTAAGEVLGTIAYMSPEQAEGEQPGPETDVYSLGLTLYEGWAGRQPVIKDTPAATARTIGDRLPPLRSFRRDLPTQLGALIDASVEVDARYRPSAADLGEGLAEVAPSLAARPLPVPGKKSRRRRRAPRPRVPAIAIAIVAMFAVIIATSHVHPDTWVVLAPIGCALLSFVRPRLALGLAAASLAVWLATSASEPLQAAALAALGAAAILRSGADLRRGGHPASHP